MKTALDRDPRNAQFCYLQVWSLITKELFPICLGHSRVQAEVSCALFNSKKI